MRGGFGIPIAIGTAGLRWREYRNALQSGKGVYVWRKMFTLWLAEYGHFYPLPCLLCLHYGRVIHWQSRSAGGSCSKIPKKYFLNNTSSNSKTKIYDIYEIFLTLYFLNI